MQNRYVDRKLYFNEQSCTSEKYYLPYLQPYLRDLSGECVLEIGCGEGGNLVPFARLGCKVTGVDISPVRIERAKTFFEETGLEGEFIASDVFDLDDFSHRFSLIILHDVIEHISNKEKLLIRLRHFLAENGIIFIAFPAWQMPFGGHQQISSKKAISHTPFIHLLPRSLYRYVLKLSGESEDVRNGLLDIQETRCSIEKFLKLVRRADYTILSQQLYFINPNYEVKFGLKPRKLNRMVAKIPWVRNFFSTACFYVLKSG